jgi:pantetheine-phosphate adenylyltransferase
MGNVVIGGTFDGLHMGHREFIRRAFGIGGKVLVCITSDSMTEGKPDSRKIDTFAKRKQHVAEFLKSENLIRRAEIVRLEDPFTPGLRPDLTHIVVSPATRANAEKLNSMRKDKGLPELEIVEIPWVMAGDGKPVSDARIRRGEIDKNGNPL